MIEVSEEMVEAACAVYAKETDYYVEFHRGLRSESSDRMRTAMRAALTAALAVAPKPRVKALEWEETYQARSDEDPNLEVTGFEANNGFGEWYWTETRAADFVLHIVDTDRTSAIFETEREAKAAAQADFERRILAALED